MTDSEHSDAEVSYTENGTFNLSRGQTPLTEGSEGKTDNVYISDFNLLFETTCQNVCLYVLYTCVSRFPYSPVFSKTLVLF